MSPAPQAKRVTLIIEVGDRVEAIQADHPEEVALRFDQENSPDWQWSILQASTKYRFGVDVDCGESGCVLASSPEAVADLLKHLSTPAEATGAPEEGRP